MKKNMIYQKFLLFIFAIFVYGSCLSQTVYANNEMNDQDEVLSVKL